MGDKKKITMCEIGVNNLRLAITQQAVKDYKAAIKERNSGAQGSLKRFFKSEWGKSITGGVDADAIEKSLRIQVKYEEWRKAHNCHKCKHTSCINRSGSHYTQMEKGEVCCGKELQDKTD